MKNSRRDFLRTGTIVGISAAVSLSLADLSFAQDYFGKFGKSGFRLPDEALLNPLSNMSYEDFSSFVNMSFSISHPTQGNQEVALINVLANKPAAGIANKRQKIAPSGNCFSLVFSGVAVDIEQGTYTITQEKLGIFDIFLVPGLRTPSGHHYEALFNRL